jgi:hypothetical protein
MKVKIIVLFCALSGCHHQAPRVDCDRHLEPINKPAPVSQQTPAPKSTS